jgi:hypothetical protein
MATGHLECRKNGHAYHWSWYCGDRVCDVCIKHETLSHCSCGLNESARRREAVSGIGSGEKSLVAKG